MSLFSNSFQPLAIQMRPKTLEEVLGQKELVFILEQLQKPLSLLFYGNPGTGKTTIAKILSEKWKLPFFQFTATSTSVKDIKDLVLKTEKLGSILLFLDEIHRFNSAQQDCLLEAIETGKLILIGSTTENPAFRINRALLSRVHIYKLKPLEERDFQVLYERAKQYIKSGLNPEGLSFVVHSSMGDARRFLGILEFLDTLSESPKLWTKQEIEKSLSMQMIQYDRSKDYHYDYISAFIKSIRGSDPDAAIYYLACMLEGGEDPLFIMRRLVILASEDIGNASVYALPLASAAMDSLEKIGMPEGRILLAHVTTYLASCPKSNSAYLSLENAIQFLKENSKKAEVPLHLRNAPTFLHKKEGNAINYKYPHDYLNHFVKEFYFPKEFENSPPQFYFPSENGMEKNLKERLKNLWEQTGWKKYEK